MALHLKFITLSFITVMIFLNGPPVQAQNLVTAPPTTAEDVGFTFYKMAGAVPNYKSIVHEDPAYKNALPVDQAKLEEQLALQMQLRFTNFNPENRLITIRSAVRVDASVGAPPGLNIIFGRRDDKEKGREKPIFFPYPFGPQMVAVIANGIEQYRYIRLSPIEASHIARKISNNTATMVLQVLPKQVDAKQPFMTEGDMPVWLMMGDIAQLVLFNNNAEVLWSYRADWVKTEDSYRLHELYKE